MVSFEDRAGFEPAYRVSLGIVFIPCFTVRTLNFARRSAFRISLRLPIPPPVQIARLSGLSICLLIPKYFPKTWLLTIFSVEIPLVATDNFAVLIKQNNPFIAYREPVMTEP